METCPRCGEQVAQLAKFCPECGAPLAAPSPGREERKVVTVVFCDLVGSTVQAERLDPEDVRAILSSYHERVRADIGRFGGTVEKFIGDAVMAVFGAPVLALRGGIGFWPALLLACAAAGVSYAVWVWAGRRVGLNF